MVGQLLDKLDELGIADNTIVMYSTDNGAEVMSWPDGGTTPFRGEKNTNWEGGYRVPTLIRWPGVIEPGTIYNDVFAHEDMLPTLLAAVGEPDIKEKLLAGHAAMGRDYKVHLDGYNLLPYLKGEEAEGPRHEFLYWTDGGDLAALRYNQWKLNFLEQRSHGFDVWEEPFVQLRLPKLFTLRARRRGGHRLRRLARGTCVRAGPGAGFRGELALKLQGLPAASESGDLRHRSGHGEADRGSRRLIPIYRAESDRPRSPPSCRRNQHADAFANTWDRTACELARPVGSAARKCEAVERGGAKPGHGDRHSARARSDDDRARDGRQ
jgi:hypothetical protein